MKVGKKAFYALARQYGLIKGKSAKRARKLSIKKPVKMKGKKKRKKKKSMKGPKDKKGNTWPGHGKKAKPRKPKLDRHIDKKNLAKGMLAKSVKKKRKP